MVRISDNLMLILREEITDYVKIEGYKSSSHFMESTEQAMFAWVVIPDVSNPIEDLAEMPILARIVDKYVVIERDDTDRPLYQELIRRGIPREQIILRYAGEKLPEDA